MADLFGNGTINAPTPTTPTSSAPLLGIKPISAADTIRAASPVANAFNAITDPASQQRQQAIRDTVVDLKSIPVNPKFKDFLDFSQAVGNIVTAPGTNLLSPQLTKLGVSPALAGGVGIVGDILASPGGKVTEGAKAGEAVVKGTVGVVEKLISAIKSAKPIRAEAEKLYSAERASRAGAGSSVLKNTSGEKGFFGALGQLKGELPKPQFSGVREVPKFTDTGVPIKPPANVLSQPEVDQLFNHVRGSGLDFYTQINAMTGLSKILGAEGGKIPTEGELKLLGQVFGKSLVDAVLTKRTAGEKFMQGLADVVNVPRALMSSLDMSAPLRQGLVLSIARPGRAAEAFGQMFKYFGSPKYFQGAMEAIQKDALYPLMRNSGLALTDTGSTAIGLTAKEEGFMSNLAERIPGIGHLVKGSERAYVGFLNKLRADVFSDVTREFIQGGFNPKEQPQVWEKLADFVNTASGRGSLGPLNKAAPVLNGMFFSPRFMASRLQMLNPQWYLSQPAPVRKLAAASMIKFVGTGLGVLSLAKLGGADVELDPRSTDFGKIRLGNIRWDIWGGYQQWVRIAAQMIAGETKSSTSGKLTPLGSTYGSETRLEHGFNFLVGKAAPVPGLIADILRGRDAIGQPISLSSEAVSRLVPLYLQDLQDAVRVGGVAGGAVAAVPAFFGVGTQSYQNNSKNGSLLPSLPGLPTLPPLPKLPTF